MPSSNTTIANGATVPSLGSLSALTTAPDGINAADLRIFSCMLTDLFPQLRQKFDAATADPELLYRLWLLSRMPTEFRLSVNWQATDEQQYHDIVAQIPAAQDVLLSVPPFINAIIHAEPWLRQQADLRTLDGMGFLVEWVYKNYLTEISMLPCVEAELSAFANAEQDSVKMPGLTRLMYLIWNRRPDLRLAYDLRNDAKRNAFIAWFGQNASQEYGFSHKVTRDVAPGRRDRFSLRSLVRRMTGLFRCGDSAVLNATKEFSVIGSFGGEFGVGQHARSVVESMDAAGLQFDMLNSRLGPHNHSNARYADRFVKESDQSINVLCLNVMSGLEAVRDVGAGNMLGRYNILYGYWELSSCPSSWAPYLNLYDEFWAPTRFIADSLRASTKRPVVHMPISVTIEDAPAMTRAELGLPQDKFLFLFHFDGHSFPSRKNAEAAIAAFKRAFTSKSDQAALIVKTKHLPAEIVAVLEQLIEGDERIVFLEGDFLRQQIIALERACDAYISLHRSEGFGMGPAEMMCMGKPVIVTNYSGNTDFTNSDNSCSVDYQLVPVKSGEYAFYEPGQVWAEPDVEQAARYMQKLFSDSVWAKQIGDKARQYMAEHHNPATIGERYKARLQELAALRRI